MNCPNCGHPINPGEQFCTHCGANVAAFAAQPPVQTPVAAPITSNQGVNFDFSTNTATPASGKRYEYKVLSQKDKWFSGKFDPSVLEQAMNAYAQQGWRVIGCATADIPAFGGRRQEFLTVMEREV